MDYINIHIYIEVHEFAEFVNGLIAKAKAARTATITTTTTTKEHSEFSWNCQYFGFKSDEMVK